MRHNYIFGGRSWGEREREGRPWDDYSDYDSDEDEDEDEDSFGDDSDTDDDFDEDDSEDYDDDHHDYGNGGYGNYNNSNDAQSTSSSVLSARLQPIYHSPLHGNSEESIIRGLRNLTMMQLHPIVRDWGLRRTGKKAEVIDRIVEVLRLARRFEELKADYLRGRCIPGFDTSKYVYFLSPSILQQPNNHIAPGTTQPNSQPGASVPPASRSPSPAAIASIVNLPTSAIPPVRIPTNIIASPSKSRPSSPSPSHSMRRLTPEVVDELVKMSMTLPDKDFLPKSKAIKRGFNSLILDINAHARTGHHHAHNGVQFSLMSDPEAGISLVRACEAWRNFIPKRLPCPYIAEANVMPPIITSLIATPSLSLEVSFDILDELERPGVNVGSSGIRYLFVALRLYLEGAGPKVPSSLSPSKGNGQGHRRACVRRLPIYLNDHHINVQSAGKVLDITWHLKKGKNTLTLKNFTDYLTKDYLLTIMRVSNSQAKWLAAHDQLEERSVSQVRAQIHRDFASGAHGISTTSMSISLRCPLSLVPLKTPVRGTRCRHLQCIEYGSWLRASNPANATYPGAHQYMQNNLTLRCPVCEQSYDVSQIYVDGLVKEILGVYPTADEVIINPADGTYHLRSTPHHKTSDHTTENIPSGTGGDSKMVDLTETPDEPYLIGPVNMDLYKLKEDPGKKDAASVATFAATTGNAKLDTPPPSQRPKIQSVMPGRDLSQGHREVIILDDSDALIYPQPHSYDTRPYSPPPSFIIDARPTNFTHPTSHSHTHPRHNHNQHYYHQPPPNPHQNSNRYPHPHHQHQHQSQSQSQSHNQQNQPRNNRSGGTSLYDPIVID